MESSYGSIGNDSGSSYVPSYEDEVNGYSYTLKNVNMIQSVGDINNNNNSNNSIGSKNNSASKIGTESYYSPSKQSNNFSISQPSYMMQKDS